MPVFLIVQFVGLFSVISESQEKKKTGPITDDWGICVLRCVCMWVGWEGCEDRQR